MFANWPMINLSEGSNIARSLIKPRSVVDHWENRGTLGIGFHFALYEVTWIKKNVNRSLVEWKEVQTSQSKHHFFYYDAPVFTSQCILQEQQTLIQSKIICGVGFICLGQRETFKCKFPSSFQLAYGENGFLLYIYRYEIVCINLLSNEWACCSMQRQCSQ